MILFQFLLKYDTNLFFITLLIIDIIKVIKIENFIMFLQVGHLSYFF